MKTFLSLAVAAVILTNSPVLEANKTYTPLPSIVLRGKTVFIENGTSDATLQHLVYMEIARWGRFRMAESRDKADVILAISGASSVRLVEASEVSPGNLAEMYADTSTEPSVPVGFTRISVVDPKTGKALWFSQRKTDLSRSRTGFLDGLRDAMEQQESSHKQK
jgi:hypothetical protein